MLAFKQISHVKPQKSRSCHVSPPPPPSDSPFSFYAAPRVATDIELDISLQMMKKAKAGGKKIARIKPKWAERVRDLKKRKKHGSIHEV